MGVELWTKELLYPRLRSVFSDNMKNSTATNCCYLQQMSLAIFSKASCFCKQKQIQRHEFYQYKSAVKPKAAHLLWNICTEVAPVITPS